MVSRVYALSDPRSRAVRYVGITCDSIERRLREHLSLADCGADYPVHRWIRKLSAAGLQPVATLLEECEDRDRECFWIAYYRSSGAKLLNCTDGGDGVPGHRHSESTRERLRALAIALYQDPEYRAKQTLARLGKPMAQETKQKIAAANAGRPKPAFTEEHCRKIGEASRGRTVSAETRAKISATTRGRPGKPLSAETRAKISAVQTGKKRGPHSPEANAKIAAALKGRKRPPEVVEKIRAALKGKRPNRTYGPPSEETRAKISAGKRGKLHGPMSAERRAKISAAKKAAFAARKSHTDASPG